MLSTEVWTIIGVNLGLFGALSTMMVWVVSKLDNDIKSLGTKVDSLSSRLDSHANRIDQLYKMFVDLLNSDR